MLKQRMINRFLKVLENIDYGALTVVTPDAKIYSFFGSDELQVNLQIKDWTLIKNIISKGDIGFAESYRDGLFDTDNLVDLCTLALKNSHVLDQYIYGNTMFSIVSRLFNYRHSNTIKGSKRNISAHYDLGNEFYSLWLDDSMTYSSALFDGKNKMLNQAQQDKYDRILERLASTSGNLIEIGCGWGGFAEHASQQHDLNIKGITISPEQYDYAKKRLGKKATIALEDYRQQTGKYDSLVSIEMLEAVGENYWSVYFNKIKSLLKSNGKAVIQTITIDELYFERYRKTGDMLRTFIFPGGMLPSVSRIKIEAAKVDLVICNTFDFGADYARTIRCWLESFETALPAVRKMNFDEKFIRVWRFYLSACIASFTSGRTTVIQVEMAHA